MSAQVALVAEGQIEQIIILIRGQKVMLDADLARVYGVEARRVREQLKRNLAKFPNDFMFRLTKEELIEVSANCGHLSYLKFSPTLPYAFTEYGAIMMASVLNSPVKIISGLDIGSDENNGVGS
ncbi:MAG: ORF6N domain-containing protein [Deltaproteobacteria bacterium]|nr:ORF6N domain-containing protein [Deltaproteobacteria bacterium]